MRRIKQLCVSVFVVVLTVAFVAIQTTGALLATAVLRTSGQIGAEFYPASGAVADIQNAVNQANSMGGGIVHVPSGTFTWNGGTVTLYGGVNIIGAGFAGNMGHANNWQEYNATTIIVNNNPVASMFYLDGRNGKSSRISGLRLESKAPTSASQEATYSAPTIYLERANNARVDHCTLINSAGTAIMLSNTWIDANLPTRAVVDHCTISDPYKLTVPNCVWGYGCYVQGKYSTSNIGSNWDTDISKFAGEYETMPANCPVMYTEDCHFSYTRHATDAIQYSWQVTRYCLIDHPFPRNYYMFEVHGTVAGGYLSARGWEAYGNTINGEIGINAYNTVACGLRGGSAFLYSNAFVNDYNSPYNVFAYIDDTEDPSHTIPQSHVRSTYIWDNTVTNGVLLASYAPSYFHENVEYFLRAPNQAQDSFTYVSYPYPHPLTQISSP